VSKKCEIFDEDFRVYRCLLQISRKNFHEFNFTNSK